MLNSCLRVLAVVVVFSVVVLVVVGLVRADEFYSYVNSKGNLVVTNAPADSRFKPHVIKAPLVYRDYPVTVEQRRAWAYFLSLALPPHPLNDPVLRKFWLANLELQRGTI